MTDTNGKHQNTASVPEKEKRFFRDIEIEFMIHELKDPISIIETGLRSLLERRDKIGPLTVRQEKTLKRTLRSSQKARQMLNGLLEIGRSEEGCFLFCGFSPALVLFKALVDALETFPGPHVEKLPVQGHEETVREALGDWGIALDISPQAEAIQIYQDEIKVRQILGNLFKNALHHRRNKMHIRMNMDPGGDSVVIEVADDGPGIKSKHSQMVFQRYTRVTDNSGFQRRGHGLGLAGARIMARCLGGEVAIVNGVENGATFQARIPVTVAGCPADGRSG
jgi:two-component system OmpR family sensor kinase